MNIADMTDEQWRVWVRWRVATLMAEYWRVR